MKTKKEIEEKIDSYEKVIKGLKKQIKNYAKEQKANGIKVNPYEDSYIVGREERIRQFETAVEMLEWVLY